MAKSEHIDTEDLERYHSGLARINRAGAVLAVEQAAFQLLGVELAEKYQLKPGEAIQPDGLIVRQKDA